MVRLLKPLSYFGERHGNLLYGFNKLFLLMEKQHNRGQDGAGIGAVKLGMKPGEAYMFRERDDRRNPIDRVIKGQLKSYSNLLKHGVIREGDAEGLKRHWPFAAEVLLGHLRYATSGGYGKSCCQPYFRKSPWPTRALMLAGNFNMTNVDVLNDKLIARGAHPIFDTDTQTVLEEIGYHLDEEHQCIYHELRDSGVPREEIAGIIAGRLDVAGILRRASVNWDGGYTLAGMIGNGDCFVMRDPHGIRPAFYFADDEVVAFASERVPLMSLFEKPSEAVREVPPGHVVAVKRDGSLSVAPFADPVPERACTFERIYFSRGNDPEIYAERKALGAALAQPILEAIGGDASDAVFSYIPNTAETAYYGLMEALHQNRRRVVKERLLEASHQGVLTEALLDELVLSNWPRGEKIANKDIKLRTFISQESSRVQLASHVYDITYGQIRKSDALVCIDDSIVRGTTLRRSILKMLTQTNPRMIVIASTAPQIRYPDCYGIDMSELGKFIAFQAAVMLCQEHGRDSLLRDIYEHCLEQANLPDIELVNPVKSLYAAFDTELISAKISEIVRPENGGWKGEIKVVFQSIENLHKAVTAHHGDWYFTGNYPTPGGYRVLNQAFVNFYEQRKGRSYS